MIGIGGPGLRLRRTPMGQRGTGGGRPTNRLVIQWINPALEEQLGQTGEVDVVHDAVFLPPTAWAHRRGAKKSPSGDRHRRGESWVNLQIPRGARVTTTAAERPEEETARIVERLRVMR
ncbi:MAG: hypothetical protein JWM32_1503 [Verrucomicrobia bacterium]|nr:hypothetical protein [Verrucomicrobiota bacterium]